MGSRWAESAERCDPGGGGISLGLAVVAERDETLAQKDIPQTLGYSVVQGYWFTKPMPPQALPAWMVEQGMSQQAQTLPGRALSDAAENRTMQPSRSSLALQIGSRLLEKRVHSCLSR